jgi:hypothetical protein
LVHGGCGRRARYRVEVVGGRTRRVGIFVQEIYPGNERGNVVGVVGGCSRGERLGIRD